MHNFNVTQTTEHSYNNFKNYNSFKRLQLMLNVKVYKNVILKKNSFQNFIKLNIIF